jgi:hypothetical protein
MTDSTKRGNIDFIGEFTFTSNSKTVSIIDGLVSFDDVTEPLPDAVYGKVYMKGGTLYFKNNSGTEFDLTAGGIAGASTISGIGESGQITFWSGASTMVGSSKLTWNAAEERLTIEDSLATYVISPLDGYVVIGSETSPTHNLIQDSALFSGDVEIDGTLYVDGDANTYGLLTTGDIDVDGYIAPVLDNVYSIGSPDSRWRSVYSQSFNIFADASETEVGYDVGWMLDTTSFGDLRISQNDDIALVINVSGEVGIGTDDPQGELHVSGIAVIEEGIILGDFPSDTTSVFIKKVGDEIYFRNATDTDFISISFKDLKISDGTTSLPSLAFVNDIDTGISRPSNNVLAFSTAGVESFRINPNGSLSIATTTQPVSPSEVIVGGGITVTGDSIFGAGVANEKVTIDGALSLIERTAPLSTSNYGKIYVSSADNGLHFVDSSGDDLNISALGTSVTLANGLDKRIAFFTDTTQVEGDERFVWDYTQRRLGIGVTNPQNALDVEGSVVIGANYSGSYTAPINSLLVQNKIGIANTNPNETLTVGGVISLKEVVSPTATSGFGKLFTKNQDLYFTDSAGHEYNLTQEIAPDFSLDGYQEKIDNLDQTVSEHYVQHSEAINTITKELDGYSRAGVPSDAQYEGLLEIQEDDSISDTFDHMNDVLKLLAPEAPGDLNGQSLDLSATVYSGRLPSGLSGNWGSYTPGSIVNTLIYVNNYLLSTPDVSTRFSAGVVTSTNSGTVTHVLNGSDSDSRDVSSGVGITGAMQITAIDTYNNIWKKVNARIVRTQAEGRESHAIKHTSAGISNNYIVYYDDTNTSPSFSVTPTYSVASETLKYLSGIGYYYLGTMFDVSYTAASGIFTKAYHVNQVSSINCSGLNTVNVNPLTPPAVTDNFVVANKRVTLDMSGYIDLTPNISVTLKKPDGTSVIGNTATLNRYICTVGDQSTTTYDNFVDEAQRLAVGTDFAWNSMAELQNGNAQVRAGTLQFANSTDYPGFSGDQVYERFITKSSASNGTLTFGSFVYTDVGAYNTGSVNIFLHLGTDDIWFDLGRQFGSNNGNGSGDSIANSKGGGNAGGSSGNTLAFTFGTYSTANNNNKYRLRIVFRNNTKIMTSISGA